jgi:hypothetical protein
VKRVAPPGGTPPPEVADGLDLRALGLRVTDRYGREFPDEDERYDPAVWRAWCRHDSQHLIQWGVLDGQGAVSLDDEVAWLARVLAARDFPLDRLARTLELCADAVAEEGRDDVAVRLRGAAGKVG